LAQILRDIKTESVRSKVIDGEIEKLVTTANIGGASVVIPTAGEGRFAPIQDFTHSLFVDRHLIEENVSLTVVNASGKTNIGESVSNLLKGYKYNVVEVRSASTQDGSELIDGTGSKAPFTRRYLEARFGVKAREDAASTTGMTLIVGSKMKIEGR
jgi:hypothetical protein